MQALGKLYDRALRYHPAVVGVGTDEEGAELFAACDRKIVLTGKKATVAGDTDAGTDEEGGRRESRERRFSLQDPNVWERILESVASKTW